MEINFVQLLFQIVNFAILFFLLRKYLYNPILKILEERAKKIHDGLEAAEKSIEEREKLEKEKRKVILEAQKNANKILEGARLRVKKLEKQLMEECEKELEQKTKKAEALAKTRTRQLEQQLRRKFNSAVADAVETLLKDTLEAKEQRAIIDRQIQKLKSLKRLELV
jgi:F-type H+-transporting ATPase subunit b